MGPSPGFGPAAGILILVSESIASTVTVQLKRMQFAAVRRPGRAEVIAGSSLGEQGPRGVRRHADGDAPGARRRGRVEPANRAATAPRARATGSHCTGKPGPRPLLSHAGPGGSGRGRRR